MMESDPAMAKKEVPWSIWYVLVVIFLVLEIVFFTWLTILYR